MSASLVTPWSNNWIFVSFTFKTRHAVNKTNLSDTYVTVEAVRQSTKSELCIFSFRRPNTNRPYRSADKCSQVEKMQNQTSTKHKIFEWRETKNLLCSLLLYHCSRSLSLKNIILRNQNNFEPSVNSGWLFMTLTGTIEQLSISSSYIGVSNTANLCLRGLVLIVGEKNFTEKGGLFFERSLTLFSIFDSKLIISRFPVGWRRGNAMRH